MDHSAKCWRAIYGAPNRLMRDQELILRFLALFHDKQNYKQPMKGFLNNFMAKHQNLNSSQEASMTGLFSSVIKFAYQTIGDRAFKSPRVLNAAIFDSVMVGLAKRLEVGAITDQNSIAQRYEALVSNSEFRNVAGKATANEENVELRMKLSIQAFADVR